MPANAVYTYDLIDEVELGLADLQAALQSLRETIRTSEKLTAQILAEEESRKVQPIPLPRSRKRRGG